MLTRLGFPSVEAVSPRVSCGYAFALLSIFVYSALIPSLLSCCSLSKLNRYPNYTELSSFNAFYWHLWLARTLSDGDSHHWRRGKSRWVDGTG